MRPRDSKGRYIKIHSDLFGYKTPPLTNSRDRNTGKEIESNNTQKSVELGTRPEGTEIPQGELLHSVEIPQTLQASPTREDPNLVDIVDMEKVNSLFGCTQNLVISQVESTTIPYIPSLGNSPFQQQPRREHWDFIPSPKRDRLGVNWFRNPLVMSDQETRHHMEGEGEHEG